MTAPLRKDFAWKPYAWDKDPAAVSAIKALADGKATADQQHRVLVCVVMDLCRCGDLAYSPDSDRDTAFALGMQHVGYQIAKLVGLDVARIETLIEQRKRPNG